MHISDEGATLFFFNRSWNFIEDGGTYDLSTLFDNRRWWNGEAIGHVLRNGNYALSIKGGIDFLKEVAASRGVDIFLGKNKRPLTALSLSGTRAALNATFDCYASREKSHGNQVATKEGGGTGNNSGPSSGTGIIVSQSGHVLTNNHVIDGCASIKVTQIGDIAKPADVLRFDKANDLAVIKLASGEVTAQTARFRIGTNVKPGETIAVYGYPLAGALSLSGNVVSGNVTSLSGFGDDVRYLQISAPIQPGNSGGPLLDSSGLIIGVVSAKLNELATAQATGSLPQNVNFAIKSTVARSFLETHSIPFETELISGAATPRPLTEIAEKAKAFTVLITCN